MAEKSVTALELAKQDHTLFENWM